MDPVALCLPGSQGGSSGRGKTEGGTTQSYVQGLFAVTDSRYPAQALLMVRMILHPQLGQKWPCSAVSSELEAVRSGG